MKKIILFLGLIFCFSILSYSQDDVKNNAVSAANDAATKAAKIISDTTAKPKAWILKNNLTLNAEIGRA
ncbi:MAG: hypothetical protein PHV76_08320, partial [Bacteroidales bacterium]|nr:hypothetical protein [Bacteroidales bacterium]